MEKHRNRIESEFNEGIPANEWESLELIISGHNETLEEVAGFYGVPVSDLREFCLANNINLRPSVRNAKRRTSRKLVYGGVSDSAAGWAESVGISRKAITKRINRGWPVSKALSLPIIPREVSTRAAANARWNR